MFKTLVVCVALVVATFGPVRAEDAAPAPAAAAKRIVMTWVPPYDRPTSAAMLRQNYGGFGPAKALTQLGLQFWKPNSAGGLVRVTAFGDISDAEIKTYVDWAHAAGIKVLLTVYNGEPNWDWELAKSAFATNRAAFVAALVAEMKAHNLDGVDIDLEGPGIDPTPTEKADYVAFMRDLRVAVKAAGKRKLVQVDSFHYIYNAPNQTWWDDLFPHVDTLASMGYQDLGKAAPDWQAYGAQRAKAVSKKNMSKLIMGLPGDYASWQGHDTLAQIKWFSPNKTRVGIGIWEARLLSPSYQTKPVWQALAKIRAQNK